MIARWLSAVVFCAAFGALSPLLLAEEAAALQFKTQFRRPIALALAENDRWLLVANRRSGSISVFDTQLPGVIKEVAAGGQLSDMVMTPDGKQLLVTDEAAGTLLIFDRDGSELSLRNTIPVAAYPVALEVDRAGSRCYVGSLWSRQLSIVDLPIANATSKQPAKVVKLSLPFAPRELLLVQDDTKLIVGDAFGGRLGIVDVAGARLESVRQIPAHNIRGLATSPDGKKLLVSHQILNDLAETTHNDVHWGVLMSNVLRWLSLDRVLDRQADILEKSHVHLAGDSTAPGADPSGMAVTASGTVLVALAGDNEIGLVQEQDYGLFRLPVGQRPTTVVATLDGRRAYVANTFDDSITLVDLNPVRAEPARVNRDLTLGSQPELTLADRGELLFYDASLSSDGWFSCHSCHTDGHTNGHLNDNLGDSSFGSAKRVLSLLGVSKTAPWAWNASVASLEAQVEKSIRTTMQGREPTEEQVHALVAYLQTLEPPPALAAARGVKNSARAARRQTQFTRLGCSDCHAAPEYTSPGSYDVGLTDKLGNRRFNPPSLRGVSQREGYFHDNRAAGLDEVFVKFKHQLSSDLTADGLRDLLSFLRSL